MQKSYPQYPQEKITIKLVQKTYIQVKFNYILPKKLSTKLPVDNALGKFSKPYQKL